MGQRYYDPSICRYTQLDPLDGGYVHARDDPINVKDPTRLMEDGDAEETLTFAELLAAAIESASS